MSFVKLDSGILDSSLWPDTAAVKVFFAALAKSDPEELKEPVDALEVRSLEPLGFTVPPGWYGFAAVSGTGLVRAAQLDCSVEEGLAALERLGAPDLDSRNPAHEGRRVVRVPGGYLVLNYDVYRQRDTTAAERQRRYRERLKERDTSNGTATPAGPAVMPEASPVTDVTRNERNETRHVTQGEEEGEEDRSADPDGGSSSGPAAPPGLEGSGRSVGSADSDRSGTVDSGQLPVDNETSGAEWRKALWKRLMRCVLRSKADSEDDGRDPPWYRDWWHANSKAVADLEGGLALIEEVVKYCEDCRDTVIRGAKDLGELDNPAKYVASRFRNFLKPHGKRLTPPPKPPAGNA